ncbi:hypothetical protein BU17DRAFT_40413 [Hysterangium stoloniferum]|nr:hypothetical protein BU17DRAFT_40413 [Hysterangium stoloniferum]
MDPKSGEGQECRLYELEQFICDYDETLNEGRVKCYPIPRIFRLCPGRPAVEITALVEIDAKTGELTVPERLSEKLPRGKPWREIIPETGKRDINKT